VHQQATEASLMGPLGLSTVLDKQTLIQMASVKSLSAQAGIP